MYYYSVCWSPAVGESTHTRIFATFEQAEHFAAMLGRCQYLQISAR